MKLKNSYFYTLREDVKGEESKSGNLLVKAGMIKKTSSGIYMYLPLGLRVLENVKNIIREEMNNAGCNEMLMPILTNEEYFEATGRNNNFGKDMFRLKDRYNKKYALGPTHEELFTIASSSKINSYKDMPFNIYQFGTKFRDEMRPRFGIIRVREFLMKDAYSFDINDEECDKSYNRMKEAYKNVLDKCSLEYKIVKADVGVMGGLLSEEFQAITNIGEDDILSCDCEVCLNNEIAGVYAEEKDVVEAKELEKVSTPNVKTIEEVCDYLNVNINKTIKSLVYKINDELVLFLVKGDRELNETKVSKLFKTSNLEMATDEDLKKVTSAHFGSLGPIGLDIKTVIDNEVKYMTNFVVGANEDGYHYINANINDFKYDICDDIVYAKEGDICPKCKKKYIFSKGIEVGNIFKLGDKYTKALNVKYLDKNNKECYPVMGCYGMGLGRIIASVVEQHNDENGIIWPINVAPFKVVIVPTDVNDETIMNKANELYDSLNEKNISVLMDNRDERVGIKFKDMDLIGIPIRVTIGKKAKEGLFELKVREEKEFVLIDEKSVLQEISKLC